MSLNPRKILNLKPICIKPGEKANLTFLDLNKKWTVNNETFKSKSRNSPFIGYELYCKPVGIFNNDKLFFNGVYY
jgi:dihydroorotase